jgi:hypothetical protein
MPGPESSLPFERPDELTAALREQGATPNEAADLLPALERLHDWPTPQPAFEDTRLLVARLAKELRAQSPVRRAIREHSQDRVAILLAIARAQVSLFRPGFWLVSALITAVGAAVVLSRLDVDQALVLRASGPLLAFLGTLVAFRGRGVRALELELACLPSPLQLAVARLAIVLGYDVLLGLALSLVFWLGATGQVLELTLSWFMPLLLVVGLAFLLSLRLPASAAASVAYASWLAILTLTATSGLQTLLLVPELLGLGCIGVVLLIIALLRLRTDLPRLLPQS